MHHFIEFGYDRDLRQEQVIENDGYGSVLSFKKSQQSFSL
jgi:hypothetical protein